MENVVECLQLVVLSCLLLPLAIEDSRKHRILSARLAIFGLSIGLTMVMIDYMVEENSLFSTSLWWKDWKNWTSYIVYGMSLIGFGTCNRIQSYRVQNKARFKKSRFRKKCKEKITKRGIGGADLFIGLMMISLLGTMEGLSILFIAMLLVALIGLIGIILKGWGRYNQLPFVPFISLTILCKLVVVCFVLS